MHRRTRAGGETWGWKGWWLCVGVLAGAARAADVTTSAGLLAFSSTSGCPNGWTDAQSSYGGRLILSTATAGNVGLASSTAPSPADIIPSHVHSSWSLQATFAPVTICTLLSSNPFLTPQTISVSSSSSSLGASMSSETTELPYVTLTLCQYTSGAGFQVPNGVVAHFVSTVNSCPSGGWTPYTAGEGRFLVFGETSTVPSPVSSPTPALTAGSDVGAHAHGVTPTPFPITLSNAGSCFTDTFGCLSNTPAPAVEDSSTSWVAGPTAISSSSLNIPYKTLFACIATGSGTITNTLPDPAIVFHVDSPTCPPGLWTESSTPSTAGRLLWAKGSSGVALTSRGGIGLSCATSATCSSPGHAQHQHYMSSNQVPLATANLACATSVPTGGAAVASDAPTTPNVTTTVETASTGLVPYRVLRGCSALPTTTPSLSPVLSHSSSPTFRPTVITSAPSMTSGPTPRPTSGKPTTSSSPVTSPTASPVPPSTPKPTARPTRLPSRSPVFVAQTLKPTTPGQTTLSPTDSASPTSSQAGSAASGPPIAIIAGAAGGGALLLAVAAFWWHRSRRSRNGASAVDDANFFVPFSAQNNPYLIKNSPPVAASSAVVSPQSPIFQQSASPMQPMPSPAFQQPMYASQPVLSGQYSRPASRAVSNRQTWEEEARAKSSMAPQYVTAIFNFEALNEDELSILQGERYTFVTTADADWSVIADAGGNIGLVPTNHLRYG